MKRAAVKNGINPSKRAICQGILFPPPPFFYRYRKKLHKIFTIKSFVARRSCYLYDDCQNSTRQMTFKCNRRREKEKQTIKKKKKRKKKNLYERIVVSFLERTVGQIIFIGQIINFKRWVRANCSPLHPSPSSTPNLFPQETVLIFKSAIIDYEEKAKRVPPVHPFSSLTVRPFDTMEAFERSIGCNMCTLCQLT